MSVERAVRRNAHAPARRKPRLEMTFSAYGICIMARRSAKLWYAGS
jgi:hypothetical protein